MIQGMVLGRLIGWAVGIIVGPWLFGRLGVAAIYAITARMWRASNAQTP